MTLQIMTHWESTERLPDEKHLKVKWQAQTTDHERLVAHALALTEWKQANQIETPAKISSEESQRVTEFSRQLLMKVGPSLTVSPIDYQFLEAQEYSLIESISEAQVSAEGPPWSGYLFNPASAGFYYDYLGEKEEESPKAILYHGGPNRLGMRAQALGERNVGDPRQYSYVRVFFTYKLTPQSYGNLEILFRPWLHGFFINSWGDIQAGGIDLNLWIDLHQHFWWDKVIESVSLSDSSPYTTAGRLDSQSQVVANFDVAAGDQVTIRVGVSMKCTIYSSDPEAVVIGDFLSDTGNYIYIPYIQWTLT